MANSMGKGKDGGHGGKIHPASVKSTTMDHYKKVQSGGNFDERGNPVKTTQVSKGMGGAGCCGEDNAKKIPKYTSNGKSETINSTSSVVSKKVSKKAK